MLLFPEKVIARARRRDGVRVHLIKVAKIEKGETQEVWAVRVFSSDTQDEFEFEFLQPSYDVACAKFFNFANLDPITPWEGLEYFSSDFREPSPEVLIREGFRAVKLPAGYSGQAMEMEIAKVDQQGIILPTGERILQAIVRSDKALSRSDIQGILGLTTIGKLEGYIIREYKGEGVVVLFASKICTVGERR